MPVAAPIHLMLHSRFSEALPVRLAPAGSVAEDLALFAVQQNLDLGGVGRRRVGRGQVLHQTPTGGAHVKLHAEMSRLALARLA